MTDEAKAPTQSARSRARRNHVERMNRIEQAWIAAQMDTGAQAGKAVPFRVLPAHERKRLERFAIRIEESLADPIFDADAGEDGV